MKNRKISKSIFFVVSALFYLVAIINFATADRSTGGFWLLLGSTFLCLGAAYTNKSKNDKNEK